MDKTFELDWPTYIDLCQGLAFKVGEAETHKTYVTGPPRGGLMPALVISHMLDMRFLEWTQFVDWWCGNSDSIREVLIVDDITCTGGTLSCYPAHTKAVVFKRVTSTVIPQIFLKEILENIWVKFPYEK